jgi:hydroxymethylpyrimidine pyrophosphatase-like HAD family hydrolase
MHEHSTEDNQGLDTTQPPADPIANEAYNDTVYVFDLDGVITNPEDSSVDEILIQHIRNILMQSGHVAVNTGRSYEWVEENLVHKLLAIGDLDIYHRLYIVCEKGGESRIWQDGTFVSQPSRFALHTDVTKSVHALLEKHQKELDTMFWDGTKQTMATIEKYPEATLQEFHHQQEFLKHLLETTLSADDIKIDVTTIATDVESHLAGKHAGAELIYEWVASHTSFTQDAYICFGDSVSDYEMARYFAQQNAKTTFVYVGKPVSINEEAGVTLVTTKALYSAGTREYFSQYASVQS